MTTSTIVSILLSLSLAIGASSSSVLGGHASPTPAQSPTPTVTLTGTVSGPDSQYVYSVDPWLFQATIAAHVHVQLSMPANTTIAGWSCQANVCSKHYDAADLAQECAVDELVIENNQTNSVGSGSIVVVNSETPTIDICVIVNEPPSGG
ncbi:MAG: hypothetical protein HC927_01320 [Deltaproteobacteria bacterium]|nr:hypothetical protein [Deltaproteobacteria bacterium]